MIFFMFDNAIRERERHFDLDLIKIQSIVSSAPDCHPHSSGSQIQILSFSKSPSTQAFRVSSRILKLRISISDLQIDQTPENVKISNFSAPSEML